MTHRQLGKYQTVVINTHLTGRQINYIIIEKIKIPILFVSNYYRNILRINRCCDENCASRLLRSIEAHILRRALYYISYVLTRLSTTVIRT